MAPSPQFAPLATSAISAGLSNLPHLITMVKSMKVGSEKYVMGSFVEKSLRPLLESLITRVSAHDNLLNKFNYLLKNNEDKDTMAAAGVGLSLVVLGLLLILLLCATREIKRRNRDHSQALGMLARRNDLISENEQFPHLLR